MAEFEGLEARVRVLEKHNRSLRWTVLLTLVLALLGLMWGRVWPGNGVVEARSFVVIDREGQPRASFGFDRSGVGLNLHDDEGRWRAGMLVDNTGRPAVFLFDTLPQPAVTLNLQRGGAPSLRMRAPDDAATLSVNLGTGVAQGLFLTRASDTVAVVVP